MNRNLVLLIILVFVFHSPVFAGENSHESNTVHGGAKAHWAYSGNAGPEHWADLDSKFSACSAGKNQSPVNLADFIEADLKPISFQYKAGGRLATNNGHTVQVDYDPGSMIRVEDRIFNLKQFHFHAPSENKVKGTSYPMEVHFVHADSSGNLAVVGVLFVEGERNQELDKIWRVMPKSAGAKARLENVVAAAAILPKDQEYYRFDGSLTTPPCTEGVIWLLMKNPVSVSKAQIDYFRSIMGGDTNRPVQAVNARTVLK